MEFRIPRDRYGNFHPHILAFLRDQEEECDRLASVLYTKGLTQEQVWDVFDQIYGQHYSKTSISRMAECVWRQVNNWLERGLESYYPVVFVDCVHIKIHRNAPCHAMLSKLYWPSRGRAAARCLAYSTSRLKAPITKLTDLI